MQNAYDVYQLKAQNVYTKQELVDKSAKKEIYSNTGWSISQKKKNVLIYIWM